MIKSGFERLLFACRWLLAPFYVALALEMLALLAKACTRVYELMTQFLGLSEEGVLLAALEVVDLTLSASLIVIVILSGYVNFVSAIDIDAHPGFPRWFAGVDFGELKLKLMSSIVAISAVKLLEAFMEVGHESDRDLAWRIALLAAFVIAALLLAIANRIDRRSGEAG